MGAQMNDARDLHPNARPNRLAAALIYAPLDHKGAAAWVF